jgi:hypothetical protein
MRSLLVFIHRKYNQKNGLKKDEVSGVCDMHEGKNAYRILRENFERMEPYGGPTHRYEDETNMDLK